MSTSGVSVDVVDGCPKSGCILEILVLENVISQCVAPEVEDVFCAWDQIAAVGLLHRAKNCVWARAGVDVVGQGPEVLLGVSYVGVTGLQLSVRTR